MTTLLALKRPGALCGAAVSRATIEQLHRAAELTLTKLAPELRRMLWIESRWLDCAPGKLAPQVRQRLELYAAIAARDARAMLARAGVARAGSGGRRRRLGTLPPGHRHARRTGAGEHEEAQRFWRKLTETALPGARFPRTWFISSIK